MNVGEGNDLERPPTRSTSWQVVLSIVTFKATGKTENLAARISFLSASCWEPWQTGLQFVDAGT